MFIKNSPDEIQSFLSDSSNMLGGEAARVVFPENAQEVSDVLGQATRDGVPVTVAGAGTGIVGGRVPFGGIVLATARLNRIIEIVREGDGVGWAVAEAGVVLADFQRAVNEKGLIYPPDPTEWSCYLGGTVATNASGARTFKYGATRNFVRRLKIALATGDLIDLRRGDFHADTNGIIHLPLSGGKIEARLPSYHMPQTRKHVSGYYVAPGMDAIDLFIGSEGTLGVITEVETKLLSKPEGLLSGIIFFQAEHSLLAFVREVRKLSLSARSQPDSHGLDARALEFFDEESLRLLRHKYENVPEGAAGAVFIEQETTTETESDLLTAWLELTERHGAMSDESWFAMDERGQKELREFRHQLPVMVNERLARYNQRKVSTDMAVPDDAFAGMLKFYKETLQSSKLQYVIFGHIGDNHVHVNIMPRDEREALHAREIYLRFVQRAVHVGGTVSAEHGIGKLKRDYLRLLYDEKHLREMAALKRAFDPACILGRGNIFAEDYL
jgi:D-lactate dehydrogenase (cytochrome)